MRARHVPTPFALMFVCSCTGPATNMTDSSAHDVVADLAESDHATIDASDVSDVGDATDAPSPLDVPPPDAGDSFVLGTTIPDETNTGVLPSVARTDYTGPTTITTGDQTFRNLNFHSLITLAAPNITFENCFFEGGATAPTTNTALVDCRRAAVSNVRFYRCTFSPRDPSVWTDAIIGHDYTAERCFVEHCVDAFGVYNQFAEPVNVHVLGNFVHEMSWYSSDPNHTDGSGTHNDCVQQQSGSGLWVIGNAFHAYRWSEGGLETPVPTQSSQIVLAQHSAFFLVSDIHVNQNFIWGGDNGVKFMSARGPSLGGGYVAYAVEAINNTWMNDDQTDYGSSLHYYTLRIDSNITLNGRTYPTTGGTDDANGNHYANVAEVAIARRGLPVKVRCDTAPVP